MRPFYRMSRALIGSFFKGPYHLRVYGHENLPKGGCIIAPNHTSFLDPPLLAASLPHEIHYLARSSLFQNRLLRWLISRLNALPVEGSAQDARLLKHVYKLLRRGEKVVIFPEGLRSADGMLKPLEKGAALIGWKIGCPIVPAYIEGTFEIWPRSKKFPKMWGHTTCIFGKAIEPSLFSMLDKKEALKRITEELEKSLQELKRQKTHPL